MSELKQCPKCGPNGAPLRRIGEMDEYRVECVECYTVKTPWFKTPGEAEAYWNAFAEGMKLQAARIAELEKEKSELLAKCGVGNWINRPPMISAPTLAEIRRELRNLSVHVIDGTITVSCKINPEEMLSETAINDNDVTAAALRLWLKVKGSSNE